MAKYIPYEYSQNLMVVINFQDQLQAGTFEHALHYLITQKLDQEDRYEEEQARRVQQSIDTISQAADKIENFLNANEPRMGQGKRKQKVKSNTTDKDSAKMTTSKSTIQGYNGVATVDKKHQIVVDAQAFGGGQEHHTLQPVLETIKERYQRLGISNDIYASGAIVTADTGFANEGNMEYLYTEGSMATSLTISSVLVAPGLITKKKNTNALRMLNPAQRRLSLQLNLTLTR